jgi:hypothetical protein
MKNSQTHAGLAQENGFAPACFAEFDWAGTSQSKAVHVQEKSVTVACF